jgi:5-(carboxyamino)imidazole ribonucleotide mutase
VEEKFRADWGTLFVFPRVLFVFLKLKYVEWGLKFASGKGGTMSSLVGVIMGSISDWETMKRACDVLDELNVPYEKKVVSAHRTPDLMFEYAESAASRGLKVIIAGAGGAAHLPGMVAAKTVLPVIGVPVQSKALNGLDSLLSIVQMPGGIPVATVAIGAAGATNAGLLAAQMIGSFDPAVQARVTARRARITQEVLDGELPL